MPELRFPAFLDAPEWQKKPLDDLISTVTPPKKIVTTDYLDKGEFPIIDQGQSDIAGWTNDPASLIKNDLPLIVFGDHTCALKLVNQPFAQGADGIKVIKANYLLTTEYLYQFLRCKPVVTEEYKRHFSILKTKTIAYPENKSGEQQKITDCLSAIDDLISAQTKKIEALNAHKKGLMQRLFPAEGETVPRLRFPEFRNANGWKETHIGSQLRQVVRPIEMNDDVDYSLVTVKRRYGGIETRGVFKGRAIKVKSQFLIKENDFLISKRQIVHSACGVVPRVLENFIVSNEYSVLAATPKCDINFFWYFAQQPKVSESFLASSRGIVIEKMLFDLEYWLKRKFMFPLLSEQREIGNLLISIDDLIVAHAGKLDTLKAHKKGLMQGLFPSTSEGEA